MNAGAGTGGVNTDFGTGFVGRSDNAGRFVGNQAVGQQGRGATSGARFGNFGGGGTNFNFGGGRANRFNLGSQFGFGGQNFGNTSSSTGTFRPQLRVGIAYQPPRPAVVGAALNTRVANLAQRHRRLNGVSFNLATNGQVTLRGQVNSEEDRKLAEMFMMLEPGVETVQNDLVVAPPAPLNPELPAP